MTMGPSSSSAIDVAANLARIRARIDATAQTAGRDPKLVRLIAVSKTHDAHRVRAAVHAGQHEFGENRIQEGLGKIEQLADQNLVWHFIGRLQSNKAKMVPGNFQWLHTLDGLALAQKLAVHAIHRAAQLQCLIQVNVIADPAKGGVSPQDVPRLLDSLLQAELTGIRLRGLMTIGPHGGSETDSRRCFASLRTLSQEMRARFDLPEFDQLSMGMTSDLEPAILEGATLVRVGSGIFGAR